MFFSIHSYSRSIISTLSRSILLRKDILITIKKGKNYIYVFEKGIGVGYQDKKGQRLVSFFDKDMSDPVRVYDYQILQDYF